MSSYDSQFYDSIRDGSLHSAEVIVPHVMRILKPKSVLDVGCGHGVWLSEFQRSHVHDIQGVDGDHVLNEELVIPPKCFTVANLELGLELNRRFDLVISLEVAEHLNVEAAERFIGSLVRHSSCVLFSAAIPHQGGTSHINEQWPSYWAEKFLAHGYRPWDFRAILWENELVEHWYAQNMLLFIEDDSERNFPGLTEFASTLPLNLVHPGQYLKIVSEKMDVEKALWQARSDLTLYDISKHIRQKQPAGYILLDDGTFPADTRSSVAKRVVESNGVYQGAPAQGDEAIGAIKNYRKAGARFIVQTWISFWWSDAYEGLESFLEAETECLLSNERCRIFRFRR